MTIFLSKGGGNVAWASGRTLVVPSTCFGNLRWKLFELLLFTIIVGFCDSDGSSSVSFYLQSYITSSSRMRFSSSSLMTLRDNSLSLPTLASFSFKSAMMSQLVWCKLKMYFSSSSVFYLLLLTTWVRPCLSAFLMGANWTSWSRTVLF